MKKNRLITPLLGLTTLAMPCMSLVSCSKTYTVTWVNEDGTILEVDKGVKEGDIPKYNGDTPTKQKDAQYTYTFAGWDKDEKQPVKSDTTFEATYVQTTNKYTITWLDENGNILDEQSIPFGIIPEFKGTLPTKNPDDFGTYTYVWDHEPTQVISNQTYRGSFRYDIFESTIAVTIEIPEGGAEVSFDIGGENLQINWGDGSINSEITHAYNKGTYRILINNATSISIADNSMVTSLVIGSSIGVIEDSAFNDCSALKEVTIQNGVTKIGEASFGGCISLTSIDIPDSVVTISNWAFRGCSELTEIDIPDSVTTIGEGAFCSCSELTEIKIPKSVETIGKETFVGCSGLEKIIVDHENGNYSSGDEGSNCIMNKERSKLIFGCKNTIIPDGVAIIDEFAFESCSALNTINIPNGVTTIGNYAFGGCSGLTEIDIPNSVTTIGDHAFYDCSGLTKINISESVTTIGNYAFGGCSGLTEIDIPDSVTTIGIFAFTDCAILETVNLSTFSSVPSAGSFLFANCTKLKSIIVPKDLIDDFKRATNWSEYQDLIFPAE